MIQKWPQTDLTDVMDFPGGGGGGGHTTSNQRRYYVYYIESVLARRFWCP